MLFSSHSMHFTSCVHIHPFIHRLRCQPQPACQHQLGLVSLAQGHLDIGKEEPGDGTSNSPVASQPVLPPELLVIRSPYLRHSQSFLEFLEEPNSIYKYSDTPQGIIEKKRLPSIPLASLPIHPFICQSVHPALLRSN